MASTIILITGTNSGIGLASSKVLACASSSYHAVMAGRSLPKLDAALNDLKSSFSEELKGTLSTIQLDVTDDASITKAVEHIAQTYGRLDVLVNNAGSGGLNIPDIRTEYSLVLETNVTGPAVVAAAFRPLILKSANPYSVYVSSGARTLSRNAMQKTAEHAQVGNRSHGGYQVSKAALNMLAVLEARDFGDQGLKVFAVSPGFVISNFCGESEEAKIGWGKADTPEESGKLLLSIIMRERDKDAEVDEGNMQRDPSADLITCAYKPVAILSSILAGAFMFICLVALSQERLEFTMPVVGSCSLAIAAACHARFNPNQARDMEMEDDHRDEEEEEEDMGLLPVQWGAVPVEGPLGHCSFTSGHVEMPEKGKEYR
ncbi:hypothetical protein ZTR_06997 [Talaromyces verruculosus]|nr:hypothetical protein ZTR_06997 [Talaromyces verruculosus]